MFNIHTTEVLLILIVALIVIGPEKLPGAIRTASLWIGRFRRSFNQVKAEIEREINADEIRRQLHNESVLAEIEQAKAELTETAKETGADMEKLVNSKTFDPGASSATEGQQAGSGDAQAGDHASADDGPAVAESKSIKEEIEEVGQQIQDVKQDLYNLGKNPRAQQQEQPASPEDANDSPRPSDGLS